MNSCGKLVVWGLALVLSWCLFPSPSHAAGRKVYMVRGQGAVSILDDAAYRKVFERIFAKQSLDIDRTGGKASFLNNFFQSDLVYLSLHSNPKVWVVANGDRVEITDLVKAYRKAGKAPGLVIVTGCQTIRRDDLKTNLQRAIGITTETKGRAYIGYQTFAPGLFSDRYFRVFLASWIKPGPGGKYRTLEETRLYAQKFIRLMIAKQGPHTGKIARFAPLDAKVADWLHIVGDPKLTFPDLGKNPGRPPHTGDSAPKPDKSPKAPDDSGNEREIMLFK